MLDRWPLQSEVPALVAAGAAVVVVGAVAEGVVVVGADVVAVVAEVVVAEAVVVVVVVVVYDVALRLTRMALFSCLLPRDRPQSRYPFA